MSEFKDLSGPRLHAQMFQTNLGSYKQPPEILPCSPPDGGTELLDSYGTHSDQSLNTLGCIFVIHIIICLKKSVNCHVIYSQILFAINVS